MIRVFPARSAVAWAPARSALLGAVLLVWLAAATA